MEFIPYDYPFPNMLVQEGSKVHIDGLESVAGQKINGATGTALRFFPEIGRWSVQLDDDDTKTIYKIHITNLSIKETIQLCIILKSNPAWVDKSENGHVLLRAGICKEGPAVCLMDDPRSVDVKRLKEDASNMGIAKGFVDALLKIK